MAEVAALSPDQWAEMSRAALDTAGRYTWDQATDRFEAALVRAVEKSKPRVFS
jgi:hypothetical protein